MMEAVQTSDMLVNLHQSEWQYNPEDGHLHRHCRENLRSHKLCPKACVPSLRRSGVEYSQNQSENVIKAN
jgi:hypothetical protein